MSTLETYRKMLMVNKHRLDDELEIQSEMMMRIASECTLRNSRMLEEKDELSRVEARLLEDFRDETKTALDVVKGKVMRHSERIRAWDRFQAARAESENWYALLEAWRQRGFTMRNLSDLYVAQYFSSDSITSRRASRDAEQDENRAAIRRASHQPLAGTEREDRQPTRRRVAE